MRIAIAEMVQETGSFSPMLANLADFETYGLYFGDEILQRIPDVGPIGGLLQVAKERNERAEFVPLIRAWAGAGGIITGATIDFLTDQLQERLKDALPVDAVFFSLHGAAACEFDDDVEGLMLKVVRDLVGPDVPVIACLDHHANVTQRMVDLADTLIGHETQPHDPFATGVKTARVLFDTLHGKVRPTMAWQKIPMITPQDQFLTSHGPMKEWFDHARELERRPGVIDVSPYPMQPWLDVLEGGWAVVVHTDNDPALARTLAAEMARHAWSMRDRFWASERVPPSEAVKQAVAAKEGLIILSDTGDSVYGGAPGDSTHILRALLAQHVPDMALVPMIDHHSLNAAFEAGVGGDIDVEMGGRIDHVFSKPVRVQGRVAALSDGLTLHIPERGVVENGRTALIEVDQVRIVLLETRTFAINHPVLYTSLGLDIADAKMVVVKTASNFQFFEPWRRGLIRVDTPGMTQSDLKAFTWKRTPKPTYPLQELTSWEPA